MEYRTLGRSDLKVSTVGLGTWAYGDDFWGAADDAESIRAIHEAIDAGVTLIDTAPAYGAGHAEEVVGKAIKGRRSEVVVGTKLGIVRTRDSFHRNLKPDSVAKEIDTSLRLLGTDYIDLWQIHWPDPQTPIEQTIEAIERIRETGKFRYLGVSNFDRALLERVRALTEVVSVQPHYSLLERTIERELLSYCAGETIGVMGYGTLAGGLLTGKFSEPPVFDKEDHRGEFYRFFEEPLFGRVKKLNGVLEQIARAHGSSVGGTAIAWTLAQPGVTCALVGARNPRQARQNAEAGALSLAADELAQIEAGWRDAGLAASA